ncbi:CAP domain-containing protein [Niallia sp. XMNu-256]|uniref:CAP domain-containing protein n=1 Tax=Niallia sp. XMNu-256 TaxID=3082444 RepID=UPI0030D3CC0C
MNKKFILSIAAAAALLVSTPGMNKAEAASPVEVQSKVYVYHAGQKIDQEQVNQLIQKYMTVGGQHGNQSLSQLITNLQKQLNEQASQKQQAPKQEQVQKPVQKPVQEQPKTEQPAQKPVQQQPKTEQPAQKPVQEQPKTEQPAQKPVQQPAQQKPVQAEKPAATTPASSSVSAFEQKVVELTNQERAKNGLPALKLDVELSKVARDKSRDMQTKNYFSHTSPTYGSPFDMMKAYGISYNTAGENIAMGQRSPEEVVNAWMNSQGHRENIMNAKFTHIGVGHVEEGNYWTQMFIGK